MTAPIEDFLALGFEAGFVPANLAEHEMSTIDLILKHVDSHISAPNRPRRYVLGLALDFVMVAQILSNIDQDAKKSRRGLTEQKLFDRYELITSKGGTTANTFSVKFNGTEVGIRKIEEQVISLFHKLKRRDYPSAYVYNTGQWHKFKNLLVDCFCLSESGRFVLITKLIDYGISIFPEHVYFQRGTTRQRLFQRIVDEFPRAHPGENGGLAFQGIAHGFYVADRPHLSIIADKVRTGSARQKRFGDIDCYFGLDIELSVEVKDMRIDETNHDRQLAGFVSEVQQAGVLGIAFVSDVDDAVMYLLERNGIIVQSLSATSQIVRTWDWPKQDRAVQGMLHHFSHIEQNTKATIRLLEFIKQIDPDHDSLKYYSEKSKPS